MFFSTGPPRGLFLFAKEVSARMKITAKRIGSLFAVLLIVALAGCAAPGRPAARTVSSSSAAISAVPSSMDSLSSDTSAAVSVPSAVESSSSEASHTASSTVSRSSSASPSSAAAAATPAGTDTAPAAPVLDDSNSVMFTIDATGDGGGILYSGRVQVNAGETIYAVLKRVCASQPIPIFLQPSGPASNIYISAIGGYGAKGMNGWKYSVDKHDGKGPVYPNYSCSSPQSPPVQPGYTISWIYASA